jgi:hypothetical protein
LLATAVHLTVGDTFDFQREVIDALELEQLQLGEVLSDELEEGTESLDIGVGHAQLSLP